MALPSVSVGSAGPRVIYTTTVDPASIAATATGDTSITVPGAKTNMVFLVKMDSLEAGLAIANVKCTTAGTVVLTLANVTVGAINAASQTISIVGF